MRKTALIVLLSALSLAAYAPAPLPRPDKNKTDAKTELKKLQGTWMVEARRLGGRDMLPAQLQGRTIVINGQRLTHEQNGRVMTTWEITLDVTKKPATIDLKRVSQRLFHHGIYVIEGDTLKFAHARTSQERPNQFDNPGAGIYAYTCRRQK